MAKRKKPTAKERRIATLREGYLQTDRSKGRSDYVGRATAQPLGGSTAQRSHSEGGA